MTNVATPNSSIYNGWYFNGVDGRYDMYIRGTKVLHITASELQIDQALDVDGASNFAGEAEFAANVHGQLTLEAGDNTTGDDAQQFTSGGDTPEVTDWAAS